MRMNGPVTSLTPRLPLAGLLDEISSTQSQDSSAGKPSIRNTCIKRHSCSLGTTVRQPKIASCTSMKLEATRAIPIRNILLQMWALSLANHLRMAPPETSQARTFQLQSGEFSKREHCGCIFEELYCQEQIQFFDIHCCFLFCLHFSIGCNYCAKSFANSHYLQLC